VNIYIDIETIPAVHFTKQQIHELAVDKVPGTYKDKDKINAWVVENRQEIFEKTSFDFRYGWIACVVIAAEDDSPEIFYGASSGETQATKLLESEFDMLDNIQDFLKAYSSKRPPRFVGWNNAGFDMPWLWKAAIRAGATRLAQTIVPRGTTKYKLPWLDLMEVFACFQYGKSSKQVDCAAYLGIAEPNPELNGSHVYKQWLSGDNSYGTHCLSDVVTLREIHKRLEAL